MRTITIQSKNKIYVDRCCEPKERCNRVERAIERRERQAVREFIAREMAHYVV